MIFGKSHIRQIILEEMNKSDNNEKIKSLISSFASELKNVYQDLKSDASNQKTNSKQDINEEGTTLLAISVVAALPKILDLAGKFALKFESLLGKDIGIGLLMWADDLHHAYMGIIKFILNALPSYRKAPPDVQKEVADTIFIVIIGILTAASAKTLLTAVSNLSLSIAIPVEVMLVKIKSGEIKEYLNKYVVNELQPYTK